MSARGVNTFAYRHDAFRNASAIASQLQQESLREFERLQGVRYRSANERDRHRQRLESSTLEFNSLYELLRWEMTQTARDALQCQLDLQIKLNAELCKALDATVSVTGTVSL